MNLRLCYAGEIIENPKPGDLFDALVDEEGNEVAEYYGCGSHLFEWTGERKEA